MAITAIRRPRYARRGVLFWVQTVANQLAAENGGKVPDVFLIDARLRASLDACPDMLDLDRYVRDCRKHWERANNQLIMARADSNLFVPGAFVTVGKRMRGQMRSLDPIADVAAWMNTDNEATENFLAAMERRRAYQLQLIDEAAKHSDCATLGDLEAKLRGYRPSPADDQPFDPTSESDDDA